MSSWFPLESVILRSMAGAEGGSPLYDHIAPAMGSLASWCHVTDEDRVELSCDAQLLSELRGVLVPARSCILSPHLRASGSKLNLHL